MQSRVTLALFRRGTSAAHRYFAADQRTHVYRLRLLSLQFAAKVPAVSDSASIPWDTDDANAWDTSSSRLLWEGPRWLSSIPHFTPLLSCHCQHQLCQSQKIFQLASPATVSAETRKVSFGLEKQAVEKSVSGSDRLVSVLPSKCQQKRLLYLRRGSCVPL